MKSVLLDTHVFVWLLQGSSRLSMASRETIRAATAENSLFVSAITPWEIAMLVSKSRLAFDRDVGKWINEALALPGIRLAPLLPEIAVASTRLPGEFHPDPADRIIVATARHFNATLMTEDKLIQNYADMGHLRTIRAQTY